MKFTLSHLSNKHSKNWNDLSCDLHRESLSPYRFDKGLERNFDKSRTTSRPTFSRFFEKYGLSKIFFFFFVLLIMTSCGSRSLDDFQEEGEGVVRSLIQDLRKIHKREELVGASSKLEKRFDHLVSIMIAAEEFTFSHPEIDKRRGGLSEHDLSDQLRVELNRLYRLEGGRQIIEKCQEKSLHRLDAFEKRHANNVKTGS